jgi:gliding motility-associated-like protein
MYISLLVNQSGCTSTKMIDSVKVNMKPLPDFEGDLLAGCIPFTVNFSDNSSGTTSSASYLWDFGDGQQSILTEPQVTYSLPGNYAVSLKIDNKNGCFKTKSMIGFIHANPVPDAKFSANPAILTMKDPTVSFSDQSDGTPIIFEWQVGDGTLYSIPSFVYTYKDTGIYRATLKVINEFGCADTLSKYIYVYPNYGVIIPNAFSPNNDNLNDRFSIKGKGIEDFTINIYDQWGKLVFASENLRTSWDGRIKGEIAPIGVYVYYIRFRDILGREDEYHGTFVLAR